MNTLTPFCNKCQGFSEKTSGAVIYPHREDLHHKLFYRCPTCGDYVGGHEKTGKPYGTLADAELRQLRMEAHTLFDPLWEGELWRAQAFGSGKTSKNKIRKSYYEKLAEAMRLAIDDCHIALFDKDQCRQAIALCQSGALT